MSDPRSSRNSTIAGAASVLLGAGSFFFLCTAGVAVYFAVVAIAIVAQHKGASPAAAQDASPPGAILLLAIGPAMLVLDGLLTWTGIRILRHHPAAQRLADASALVSLLPAAGVLALVLGVHGFESGWLLVVVVWIHFAFAMGLAASFRFDPTRKRAVGLTPDRV